MRLRTLIAVDVGVFVIAAIVFIALLPSNVEEGSDRTPLYMASFWVAVAALILFGVLSLVALLRRISALALARPGGRKRP